MPEFFFNSTKKAGPRPQNAEMIEKTAGLMLTNVGPRPQSAEMIEKAAGLMLTKAEPMISEAMNPRRILLDSCGDCAGVLMTSGTQSPDCPMIFSGCHESRKIIIGLQQCLCQNAQELPNFSVTLPDDHVSIHQITRLPWLQCQIARHKVMVG
ncbi:hypothetical protein AMTR_s00011p00260470 [Amborella trichopoda]|uniref:Uncharacterized protein n=1 Tax=Amborella trichopoda TaxID=13333 RepID=W1NG55_AMBTC|nr:hypothetical protein AMTR_s00011p00260470 [Amborella trichopoda]